MINISIAVTNLNELKELEKKLKDSEQKADKEIRGYLSELKDSFQQGLKAFAPKGETGALSNSFSIETIDNGELSWILRPSSTKTYAELVARGTKGHMIYPRPRTEKDPRLEFFWKKKGAFVRLKRVKHPGSKPADFDYKAIKSAMSSTQNNLDALADRLFG